MKDLPQIPFIRELMKDSNEEDILDAEKRMHQLCVWLQKTNSKSEFCITKTIS